MMTADQYREHVTRLGMTISSAARLLGISERSTRRLSSGDHEVPMAVELVLRLMVKHGITPDEAIRIAGRKPLKEGWGDRRPPQLIPRPRR